MFDRSRRQLIGLLGGATVWPQAAWAQSEERGRRIAVLMGIAENDPDSAPRIAAFQQALEKAGWKLGRNLHIRYRWAAGEIDRIRSAVAELVGLAPEVILADGTPALRAVQQAAGSTPIVFTVVSEPVAAGFVQSLAHPGGNITGFSNLEPNVGAKWLELLKEIAPGVSRVALVFNPDTTPVSQQSSRWAQTAAGRLAIEAVVAPVHDRTEIETAVATAGRVAGGGLILPQDSFTSVHRQLIVDLAARHRLPAVYAFRYFATAGGLVSYGIDIVESYRQAAGYIDRILRGEKPANLPVQQPTKFELVVNLKTAKALGLTMPQTLLARADEVIE